MKRLLHLLLVLIVLSIAAWPVWRGLTRPHGKEEAAAEKHEAEEEHEAGFTVELSKEKAELLGLETQPLAAIDYQPRQTAFGRVLDPLPLLTVDEEIAGAEVAAQASKAERDRTEKLLATGENASRKAAEAAEAQSRADQIKLEGLRRRTRLAWGEAIASLDANGRRELIEKVVAGKSVLVQAELLPGDLLAAPPQHAELELPGPGAKPLVAATISPAASVDPKTQAQAFILRFDDPPTMLAPGLAVSVQFEVAKAETQSGFRLPRAAILRNDGQAWVYLQVDEEEKFARTVVQLQAPLGEDWFVPKSEALASAKKVVTAGAQSLLSEELKPKEAEEKEE